ncbi:MAG: metalloregulator ArsR/SmtB family transcription factor [Fimbriimonas sp.]|nr:metalloregulator ArsR/SmtB family transcription factor [Fimbriimonas sp.]
MTALNDPHYKQRADLLKAMAHPSRLRMLAALEDGPLCVCDLQKIVGSDMSTVSKHLSVMRAAGLVSDQKRGLQVFYELRVPCIMRFFACMESVLNPNESDGEAVCTT